MKLPREPSLPMWQLILITLPWFGVQFSWSAEFTTQTPYMLSLGLSKTLSTLTWMAGPISGLLVQPVVGTLSDQCRSRLGRRRPYILGGMVVALAVQFLYAWSLWIGRGFGDHDCNRGFALWTAIAAFWIMDCSLNVLQTPLRAIVADIAPSHQQELGQALVSLWSALGSIVAFLFGYIMDPVLYIREYFAIASCLLFFTCIAACVVAKERSTADDAPTLLAASQSGAAGLAEGPSARRGWCSAIAQAFRDIAAGVANMPDGMRRNCLVQFLTWAVWFTYTPNWGAWMGQHIYGGHPSDPGGCNPAEPTVGRLLSLDADKQGELFSEGMKRGSLGQALAALLQFVFSLAAPPLSSCVGFKRVYMAYMLVFIGTFLGMGLLPPRAEYAPSPDLAVVLMALTGIPLAATNIFPFALVGRLYRNDPNVALYMGALNIFIVLPQLLDTVYTGVIADKWGWNYTLLVGAGWAVFAFLSVALLKVEDERDGSDEDDDLETSPPPGDAVPGASVQVHVSSVSPRKGAAVQGRQQSRAHARAGGRARVREGSDDQERSSLLPVSPRSGQSLN